MITTLVLFQKFLGRQKELTNLIQMEPKFSSGLQLQLVHSLPNKTSMLNDVGPRETYNVRSGNVIFKQNHSRFPWARTLLNLWIDHIHSQK